MTSEEFLNMIDKWVARAVTYGLDISISVLAAFLFVAVTPLLNKGFPDLQLEWHVASPIGFFSALVIQVVLYARPEALAKELAKYKKMQTDGVISQKQYERLTERAIDWYSARRFGGGTMKSK